MKKIKYDQVIKNAISHLNKNYTEGQLGFTEKIHLSEEITALVSGLVDSINECIEDEDKHKYAVIADQYFSEFLIEGEAICECEGSFEEIARVKKEDSEPRLFKCQQCEKVYMVMKT